MMSSSCSMVGSMRAVPSAPGSGRGEVGDGGVHQRRLREGGVGGGGRGRRSRGTIEGRDGRGPGGVPEVEVEEGQGAGPRILRREGVRPRETVEVEPVNRPGVNDQVRGVPRLTENLEGLYGTPNGDDAVRRAVEEQGGGHVVLGLGKEARGEAAVEGHHGADPGVARGVVEGEEGALRIADDGHALRVRAGE